METNRIYHVALLLALIAVVGLTGMQTSQNTQIKSAGVDSSHPAGRVCFVADFIGNPHVDLGCVDNTVTNLAKNMTRDVRMGRDGWGLNTSGVLRNVSWTYLQPSSDTGVPAATDATCPSPITTNGFVLAGATAVEVPENVGNYSVQVKWTATGAITVSKICLHNGTASVGPLMASAKLAAAITFAATENLTAIYYMGDT